MPSRPMCEVPGCDEHFACRLRNKGLQVSPRAQMTRTQNWTPKLTKSIPPARNKEIIYDERPGGTKVPILNPDGTVLRRKAYEENRHHVESTLRRIRSGATT